MLLLQRNVDPRHLLRLGSGERDLREILAMSGANGSRRGQGEKFNKEGRVNWSLTRRIQLLSQVQTLGESLNVNGDVGYTCETAEYFYKKHILSRIEKFEKLFPEVDSTENTATSGFTIPSLFPFHNYFQDVPETLFNNNYQHDLIVAKGCFRHIQKIFNELSEYRAFELLRTHAHRSDYLLIKQVIIFVR